MTQVTDRLTSIDRHQIRIAGEMGRRLSLTIENDLLALDVEHDFLQPFQDKTSQEGFVGLGKLVDALVRLTAYSDNPRLRERKDTVIRQVLHSQEPDGYIGAFTSSARIWNLWDLHEMAFLTYGLVSEYRFFGNRAALAGARRLADYMITRLSAEPTRPLADGTIMPELCSLGLEQALIALYEQSGDVRYRDFCLRERHLADWDRDIVLGRHGAVEGHAYAYLCRCMAQLELYRHQGDARLLQQTQKALDFLRTHGGLVVTGTCGYQECWHDNQDGSLHLGETCTTAYLLWVLDSLLRLQGNALYGDMMERAIYNALFGAQSPDGRAIRYYTPFEGQRFYFGKDTYCCPNNFRRIMSDLPAMIYYRADGGVAVNLYTASTATISLQDGLAVRIEQETDYPTSGEVHLRLYPSQAATFPLQLRIPRWCQEPAIAVNGQPVDGIIASGTFFALEREWQPGDSVTLSLPMRWRFVRGRQAQAGRAAILRGPQVFCLSPTRAMAHQSLIGADLRLLIVDPDTLEGPLEDHYIRPEGISARIRAWSPGHGPIEKTNITLTLSEFPDPGGEATFFNIPRPDAEFLEPDELCGQDHQKFFRE